VSWLEQNAADILVDLLSRLKRVSTLYIEPGHKHSGDMLGDSYSSGLEMVEYLCREMLKEKKTDQKMVVVEDIFQNIG
jgi:hypothetical protein